MLESLMLPTRGKDKRKTISDYLKYPLVYLGILKYSKVELKDDSLDIIIKILENMYPDRHPRDLSTSDRDLWLTTGALKVIDTIKLIQENPADYLH